MSLEPRLHRPVGLNVPEAVLLQPEEDTVHENAASGGAGNGIAPAPDLQR